MTLQQFLELVENHQKYRKGTINLIASENYSSSLVRAMLATDLGNRYSSEFYGGTKFIRKIIEKTESYLKELFDTNYAIVSALSGNLCVLALTLGLTKVGNKVMVISAANGGYPLDYNFFNRRRIDFRYSMDDMNLLINENIDTIKQLKPKLVIFGSSFIPFPFPVKEITAEFSNNKTIQFAYDGSHVLGLIAGGKFQDPLHEGAYILIGSTHKTFPGPQGGVILTDNLERFKLLSSVVDLDLGEGIRLVDNNHPNRIAALGIATLEMLEFGKMYAEQIVKNSKALAKTLDENGVPVKFKHLGFSESHQIILNTPTFEDGARISTKAEEFGIIIDSGIRLGTAEVTRIGMKEPEMEEIGEIFSKIYFNDSTSELHRRIKDLTTTFSEPSYCFKDISSLSTTLTNKLI